MGLLYTGAGEDRTAIDHGNLSLAEHDGAHHFCPHCGCTTYSESPDWSKGEPDFTNPKVGINARLFDDFELAAVPVTVIDGKNLW